MVIGTKSYILETMRRIVLNWFPAFRKLPMMNWTWQGGMDASVVRGRLVCWDTGEAGNVRWKTSSRNWHSDTDAGCHNFGSHLSCDDFPSFWLEEIRWWCSCLPLLANRCSWGARKLSGWTWIGMWDFWIPNIAGPFWGLSQLLLDLNLRIQKRRQEDNSSVLRLAPSAFTAFGTFSGFELYGGCFGVFPRSMF